MNKEKTVEESTKVAIAPMQCYMPFNYKEIAERFNDYFTQNHFLRSKNPLRKIYDCEMAEIDFWLNIQHYDVSNAFNNDAQKLKNGMFYHLKKMGWKPTLIRGRWKKEVWV